VLCNVAGDSLKNALKATTPSADVFHGGTRMREPAAIAAMPRVELLRRTDRHDWIRE